MTLAGHGKDDRLIQVELPIAPLFQIGDRVTHVNELLRNGIKADFGTVTSKKYDKRKQITWLTVAWDDGTVYDSYVEGAGTLKVVNCNPFKVGDRVKDKDNFVGKIVSVSDRCITASNETCIKSYNLSLYKDINSFIKLCLPTSTSLEVSEPLALQPVTLTKSQPSRTSTSAKTRKKSINPTSIKSPSIPISESITQAEALISSLVDSPVQEQAPQVAKLDLTTQTLLSGLSISDVSMKDTPSLSSSRTPLDYFIVEWERSLQAYPQAGTMRSGKFSALPCLEVPKKERGCLSLPTLMTGLGSRRNAGATKSEKWLKDKGYVQNTQALNPQMMALLFAFPVDWTECLLESPKESKVEIALEPCLGEQSILTVPPLQSSESSICIEFSVNNLDARLSFLLEQRDRLISSGASAQGIWINCGKVPNRDFKQAVWKSDKPRPEWSGKKSQYIGKFEGDEHLSAIAQHRAGQELRKVEREIKSIEKKL